MDLRLETPEREQGETIRIIILTMPLTQKDHFVSPTKSTGTEPDWSRLSLLYRLGFLIRRLHQVHGALALPRSAQAVYCRPCNGSS